MTIVNVSYSKLSQSPVKCGDTLEAYSGKSRLTKSNISSSHIVQDLCLAVHRLLKNECIEVISGLIMIALGHAR